MRIGQFIQSIDVTAGGTSTAFLNTLAALRTRPSLTVAAYCRTPVEGDTAWEHIRAHPGQFRLANNWGRGLKSGDLGTQVVRDICAGEIDLLHIHGVWSPDLMAAGLACLRAGVPYFWEPHGMLVREAYAQKRWKKDLGMLLGMRRALRNAAGMIYVTTEERDTSPHPSGIPPERKHVVPLPVQMPPFNADAAYRARARERFGIPPSAPCIVFMGRFHPVKRLEMLLDAAAILSRTRPDLHALIVGGGGPPHEAELRDRAQRLGLAPRILFPGWVKGDDKWLALAAGEVLTLHSVHENFGFVAVEALCVGTLPVLTENLAISSELRDGDVAELAEPTADSLAAAWNRAIDANRAAPIGDRGRAWVREHLSESAIGEQLERLYASILAGGRR